MTRFQIRKKLRKAAVKTFGMELGNVSQSITGLGIRKTSLKTIAILGLGVPFSLGLATGVNAAVIGNGTIQLGIRDQGNLGSAGVGLKFLPTNGDGIIPGCLCEGWGVADAATGISGYANAAVNGVVNLDLVSFVADAMTAKSVVKVDNSLEVTHEYTPATETNFLYRALVSIKNISSSNVADLRYRRVMDWDIPPNPFREYVSIKTSGATNVLATSDNGFATANPLGSRGSILFTGEAVDSGIADHGALFDFAFGGLDAGSSRIFEIFYGAAPDEASALTALAQVGANQVYSLGQAAVDPVGGTPNTFIFGFKGVGEPPVTEPVPEPFTILGSIAAGSIGVVLRRKQKQQQAQTQV
jgi:hypothetical protein